MFKQMTKIKTLILSGNSIEELHVDQFSSNENLVNLEIDSNQITYLSPAIFKSLTKLEYLSLGSNNLAEIPPNLFEAQSNLKELSMNRVGLTRLETQLFRPMTKLEHLKLYYNEIEEIDREVFNVLRNLKTLIMGFCKCANVFEITEFTEDALENIFGICFKNFDDSSMATTSIKVTSTTEISTLSANAFGVSGIVKIVIVLIYLFKGVNLIS